MLSQSIIIQILLFILFIKHDLMDPDGQDIFASKRNIPRMDQGHPGEGASPNVVDLSKSASWRLQIFSNPKVAEASHAGIQWNS